MAVSAGDLIIVLAYNNASTTVPSAPDANWTTLSSGANSGSGTNRAYRCGWRVAPAGGLTGTGVWANATHVAYIVLRGQKAATPIGNSSANSGNNGGTLVTYNAVNLSAGETGQWMVALLGRVTAAAQVANAPTGMTNHASAPSGTPAVAAHSTDSVRATNWPSTNVSGFSASSKFSSIVIEVLAAPPQGVEVAPPKAASRMSALVAAVNTGAALLVPLAASAMIVRAPGVEGGSAAIEITPPVAATRVAGLAPGISIGAAAAVPAARSATGMSVPAFAVGANILSSKSTTDARGNAPAIATGAALAAPLARSDVPTHEPTVATGAAVGVLGAGTAARANVPVIAVDAHVSAQMAISEAAVRTPTVATGADVRAPAAHTRTLAFAPATSTVAPTVVVVPRSDCATHALAPIFAAGVAISPSASRSATAGRAPRIDVGASVVVPAARVVVRARVPLVRARSGPRAEPERSRHLFVATAAATMPAFPTADRSCRCVSEAVLVQSHFTNHRTIPYSR